jgi:CarD family transcriptional regulator
MTLTTGNKVVYPYQGLCLIGPVVRKVVDGRPINFYHLALLDGNGGDLFVPLDKVEAIGIRMLIKKSEIPKLMERLKQPAQAAAPSSHTGRDHLRLLASGSAFDLASIVRSLTELRETKGLSSGEYRMLERARGLLIEEIAEVMKETKEEAEEQIDKALEARKEETKSGAVTGRGSANACHRSGDSRKVPGQRNRKAGRKG